MSQDSTIKRERYLITRIRWEQKVTHDYDVPRSRTLEKWRFTQGDLHECNQYKMLRLRSHTFIRIMQKYICLSLLRLGAFLICIF